MADFFAIVHPPERQLEASRLFDGAVRVAVDGLHQPIADSYRTAGHRVATFARRNGTGGALAVASVEGAWLAAAGTWFHDDGLASGEEMQLLDRVRERGLARVAAELDGAYAIVFGHGDQIDLITDRVGECRVYAARHEDIWLLSGSSLLLAALADGELNPTAVQEFLYGGVIYEDRSLFAGVERLRGARAWQFIPGERRVTPTWVPRPVERPLGLDDAADRLHRGLAHAADRIATRFHRIACDLTGGYDSRAILAGFLAGGHEVATTVRGETDDADVRIAGRIAAQHGLSLRRYPEVIDGAADWIDEALLLVDGEYEVEEYASIAALHHDLSQHHDISVNGSFGEMARGYWFELLEGNAALPGRIDAERIARSRYATGAWDTTPIRAGDRIDLAEHMTGVVRRATEPHEHLPRGAQLTIAYADVRMAGWQARIASATQRLWPCVSPFLFRDVFELPLHTDPAAMHGGRLVRRMFERCAPDLARLPLADGHPAAMLRWNNAHRFLPFATHMAGKVVDRLTRPLRPAMPSSDRSEQRPAWPADRLARIDLFDEDGLTRFVGAAAVPGFGYHDQWLRLRTLDRCLAARERLVELAASNRNSTAASA